MRRRLYAQTSTASLETCLPALFCEGTCRTRWTTSGWRKRAAQPSRWPGVRLAGLFFAAKSSSRRVGIRRHQSELAAFDLLDMALMSFLRAVFESSFDGAMNELKSSADSDVTLSSASQQNGRSPCAGLRPDSLLLKTSCAAKAQQ